MKYHWLRLCLVASIFGVTGAAYAKDPKGPSKQEQEKKLQEAKRLFEEASIQYKTGEYELALEGFKGAYLISQEPAILFNIGQCQRQLNQFDEAIKAYKTFIRDAPQDPLTENAKTRIKELEEELAKLAKLGSIQVLTNPDGALVFVDEKEIGKAPIQLKNVNAGEHTILVQQSGYYPYELRFELQPGQAFSVRAPLRVEEDERDLLRPKFFYLVTAGTGTLGAAFGAASLLFINAAKQKQLEPGPEFIETREKAVVFGLTAQVLLGTALVSGTSGFFLSRFEKKAALRK
jgi:tetratricopeptide (TPR) repeat protein